MLLFPCPVCACGAVATSIDIMLLHRDYTVMEGETLTATCQVGCNSNLVYEWRIQVPRHKRVILDLNKHASVLADDLFSRFNADLTNTSACSTTSKHLFYLKLYEVKVGLNNSVVTCGVTHEGTKTYATAVKFIFVTRPGTSVR